MRTIPPRNHSYDDDRKVMPLQGLADLIGVEDRHLAALVEHSNEVIVSLTLNGLVLSWNSAAETVYGYTADEMLGRPILVLSPKDAAAEISSLLARIREGHWADRLETAWQRKDGGRINVALILSPIKNAFGSMVAISIIARDMALEKKLKTELDFERALIESAFNALRDIFFVVDLDGRLLRWNNYLGAISGYTDAELARMHAFDFFTDDGRREVERAIAEVLAKGEAHLEADGLAKDGRIIPFELLGSILNGDQGKPFAICGIARDVSDRRKAEEILRLTQFAIDHCSDAAYWMEPDGRIFYVNREACRVLGYTRDELLGKSVYDIDPNFEPDTWIDHWRLIKENRSLRLESVHRTKAGQNIPVDISANYVRFGDRECNCAFARDLTEKKRAEQKAREYEIRMHMSQRMEALGALAGGIAHDFNNILSSIIGFSELALDNLPPETEVHDNVREILTAGMRARDLVRQILTFSRQVEHEKLPLQIKIIVKEALKLLRASIPATIDIRSDLQCDDLILADASQMHQIIMNLCTNANQSMQPEGGTLQVTLKKVELTEAYTNDHPDVKPGVHVELTVADTGKGIEPGILDRIFNPFFTTKKQGEGTGLGLSMVHGIVSDHGGHILVRSKVGKGSVFTVYLPVLERNQVNVYGHDAPLPTGAGHILLVDDEPAVGNMTMVVLQRLNYRVTLLSSSIEALAYFNEDPAHFDLVITDMNMPHLPGHKLAAELIRIRPNIPVVLCTESNEQVGDAVSLDNVFKAFLKKPVEKKKLAEIVHELLNPQVQK
ncbi:MAG: PAS domain S-box protein [Desulfobacteraceae bacterium]|nr:MAG: PAS domain S-box protein [Desulfobacteraceae bacterium]